MLLASESQHEGNSVPSVGSPVVAEERIKPYWLESVLCVSFTDFALCIRLLEGHSAHAETRMLLIPKGSLWWYIM